MLKVLSEGEKEKAPCALLLGGFDGFHDGHRVLLAAARATGLPVGLTSIAGGKAGGDVFTFAEREIIFAREGFAFVCEIVFSERVRRTPAEEFLRDLFARIPAREVFCGEDFRFGADAAGTPELLGRLAPCPVTVLPLRRKGGEKLAVSRVKDLLAEGEMLRAGELLGYPYFVQGVVEHGRAVGRTYGFPTLNVSFPPGKFPFKEGVYAGRVRTPRGIYPSIVNFGGRPTFGLEGKLIEAYLHGFSGDLYGETVEICPTRFLRPVQKFDGAEALKIQLQKDIQEVLL